MSTAPAQLPRPGDMIAGKYVLDRLLGQGGMGAVFAARHLKLSKAVAIKIMLADTGNPEALQRFINEGRAAANIQNEHVVRVDDVDEEMGYAYMVLELLEGKDLAQVLEADPAKRLAPHVAVGYVLQGLRGVAQAHAIGIVHRDLKPSNLFLAKRKDGSDVVKVLDFGISKATGAGALGAAPSALTSTKAMLGSPLYMSPEQLRNAKGVDHRADIWAMGVILYELMTGQLPFMGDNLGELFAAILETDPVPLHGRIGNAAPPGLNEVVLRCLARKPEARFQSAAELMQALAPYEYAVPGAPMPAPMPMMVGTAQMPAGMQTGPHAPAGMGMTPMRPATASQPNMPAFGASSQSSSQNAAMPPGFSNTTGSGWQQSNANGGMPKSKLPIILGSIFALVAAIGICTGLFFVMRHPHEDAATNGKAPPAASSIATPEPSTSATPPPPAESVAVAPAPTASTAPATSTAAGPAPIPVSTHHTTAPATHPATPTTAPAPAPAPAPHNPVKPPEVQNNR